MTKKFISKLVVFLLSAVLLLPATLSLPTVKADEVTTIDAFPGVEFSFKVTDEDVTKANTEVIITVNDGEKDVELFNKTIKKDTENTPIKYVLSSYTAGKVTARITKAGSYTFKVKTIPQADNDEVKEFTQKVEVHSDVESLKGPSYKYLSGSASDVEKLDEYELRAQEVSYVGDGENKTSLYVDDTYTVPTIENLVNLGSFSYEQYRKTVNYAVPGSSSYSTSSASGTSNMTFTITKVGTYRFYVLLSLDEIDGKTFNISVNKLKEYHDGFYSMKKSSDGTPLYLSGSKYYTDEDLENEYVPENEDLDVVQDKLIVPIFEFTIENAGPNVKITSTYQENGYIGLNYEIKSVKVTGNEVSTSYALKYREGTTGDWIDATEEFDEESMTFVPEKQGYYKLVVTAIDSDGKTSNADTREIKVVQKYETVDYQTGFNDWISVNYVPFIFLCISGLCLIAIILLLVIKPKEKTEKVKVEEDK